MDLLNKLPLGSIGKSVADAAGSAVAEQAAAAALAVVQRQLPRLVDSLLDELNGRIAQSGLDPLPLPGASVRHSAKLCSLMPAMPAVAQLAEAGLSGLATVRQEAPAEATVDAEGGVTGGCHLRAGPLSAAFACSGHLAACGSCFPIGRRVRVACDSVSIEVRLIIKLDSREIRVEDFNFEVGEVAVEVTGLDEGEEGEGGGGGCGGGGGGNLAEKVAIKVKERLTEAAKELLQQVNLAVEEAASKNWPF